MKTHEIPDTARLERTLEALADPVCRDVLAQLAVPKTGAELVNDCDVSSSTVYRKLELLTECGLVESRIVLRPDYRHTTRYSVAVDEVTLSLEDVRRIARRDDGRD